MLGRFAAQLVVGRLRAVGQRGERGRHERGRERRCRGDAHGAGAFIAERPGARLDRAQADQRAFDFLVQQECAPRRRDARAVPVEQRVAEIGFEPWICRVTAGCERPSSSPAPVTLPADMTAEKASS